MDRLIYVAMSGAQNALTKQATVAHNLANATTVGFRAALDSFRALPVVGPASAGASPTRVFVTDTTVGADFQPGAIEQTGRALDVAVAGAGWIAVQDAAGNEAYTRAGNLQVSQNGVLQTRGGLTVVGDAGPLSVPPDSEVSVGRDGTVSLLTPGQSRAAVTTVGRIKLVNPPDDQLVRGDDGLFRTRDGQPADADAAVNLTSGAVEASNVNLTDALVDMIAAAREYELNLKLLSSAQENDRAAAQVVNING